MRKRKLLLVLMVLLCLCLACGTAVAAGCSHVAKCNEDVCYKCGKSLEEIEAHYGYYSIEHVGVGVWRYDDLEHWQICEVCGGMSYPRVKHAYHCYEEPVCYACGASDVTFEVWHSLNKEWRYDETQHWQICMRCEGIAYGPAPHATLPGEPEGICSACGASYTPVATAAPTASPTPTPTATPTASPTPTPTATPVPTATEVPVPKAVWDASLGKLVTPEDPTYTGFVDFEGGKFYIKNGQQATDFVAPVEIDGIFYAFEHGRVQMENLMTAFEGGLFAFNGGTLRTDLTGLAEYNGEKFVFSQGQYQRSANGPYLDPISGKWVYVNEGQFYPITDLITYEGEIFYFIDGILASNYTGIVYDFNGTGLYIASGQHYKITDLVSCSNGEVLYVVDGRFASWYTGVVKDFKGEELNVVNGKVVQ